MQRLEILQTSLNIAVFPEPVLSNADVAQHILDSVVAQCHPSVMLEDSVLNGSRTLDRLVSILLMSLSVTQKKRADIQELDLLPFVFGKIAHLLDVLVAKLASALDKVLPRNRFILISGSKNFSLWMKQSRTSLFALIIQSFSCSLCYHLNRFFTSKKCRYTLRVCYGILSLPRMHTGLIWYQMETVNILHGVATSL